MSRIASCPVFIGRSEELDALTGARRALSRSRGGAVLIEGDAGIGKTRLLEKFDASIPLTRERRRLKAECAEWGQAPLAPLRSFASALLARVDGAGIPDDALAVAERIASDEPGDRRTIEKGDLFAGLAAFFASVATERATIFSIEDLHWADRTTLEFLTYWVPRIAVSRQMLVVTYRSDRLSERGPLFDFVSRVARESSVVRLPLAAFDPVEMRTLIEATLADHTILDANARADVARRAGGNPLFAEELLKAALSPGAGGSAIPLSIRASVLERTRRLEPEQQRILAHAAVLGARIDTVLLGTALGCSPEDVAPALRRACELGILIDERPHGLRFRHALTQRTIYEEIPSFDVRPLHERLMRALEAGDGRERSLDDLAYHAFAAGDRARALHYNEAAGERAVAVSAFAEAHAYFERALESATDDRDRARLNERAGFSAQQRGDLKDGLRSLVRAFDLRVERSEFDDAARVLVWIVSDRSNLGDVSAAGDAETFADRHGDATSQANRDALYALAARLYSALYDRPATQRALAKLSKNDALEPTARQNALIAALNEACAGGDTDGWRRAAHELFATVGSLRPFLAAIALFTLAQTGTPLAENGDVERALELAMTIVRERGYGAVETFGHAVRARYELVRGRVAGARADFKAAFEGADVFVARYLSATIAWSLSEACGEPDLCDRALDAATLSAAREGEIIGEDALVLAQHAQRLAADGHRARAAIELGLALRSPHLGFPLLGPVVVAGAELLGQGDLSPIVAILDGRLANGESAEPCLAHDAMLALAEAILIARGLRANAGEPHADALAAAEAFRRVGWPLFEARALETAGRVADARELRMRCGARAGDTGASTLPPLTERERDLGMLVREGFTNAAIAERLHVSVKTVERQLANLVTKLGVRKRSQVAALFARESS